MNNRERIYMVIKMNYGQKIKELRERNGITQKELSRYLGIDAKLYSHYETEDRIIPCKHLYAISLYFNVSLDYLFEFTNMSSYKSSKKKINKVLSGERLRNLRKENKITQDKLAKILNVSRSTIAEYERGTNLIATPFLYTICKKYNISADYLLGKIDSPKYLN